MRYENEMRFLSAEVKKAFHTYATEDLKQIEQKSAFDLVTEVDRQIETYLSDAIKKTFPGDLIHGEEMSNETAVSGRTWTIDPIDGTCNMAAGIKLYGVQCSMIEDGDIVLAYIYLPFFAEEISAVRGEGCLLNGKRVYSKAGCPLNSAVISFGDYPHKTSSRIADWQHDAIRRLYGKVEKIRMFGAACLDFSFVATGKTAGTVVITNNLWDIAPGILLCEEAGAVVTDLRGKKYRLGSEGVIAGADGTIARTLGEAFEHKRNVNPFRDAKEYDAVVFDFDGVIMDTEKYHYLAWKGVLEPYGISLTEADYDPLRSTGSSAIADVLLEKYAVSLSGAEKSALIEKKRALFSEMIAGLSEKDLIPGVIDYLDYLKSNYMKMAVASSSVTAIDQLKRFDLLRYFDFAIDGTNDLKKKPAPDVFLKAAEQLRSRSEETLVFEDSFAGAKAALAGGFDLIKIGLPYEDAPAIADFTELTDR